ncbi:hypothetical protein GCM10010393_53810 [Streptomyces gobitricini]|uniref:Transposase n=1 Tax=Streptomyces gobitricini TaxID=68211 RepID=A0ABN3N3M5_9ACTN
MSDGSGDSCSGGAFRPTWGGGDLSDEEWVRLEPRLSACVIPAAARVSPQSRERKQKAAWGHRPYRQLFGG